MLRTAAFAAAAVLAAVTMTPAMANTTPNASASCEEVTFRVYFGEDSASLSPLAMQTIEAAERQVAGCSYAELHVSVDASSMMARERGEAVMSALGGRSWNVAQIEARTVTRVSAGPDYAEVLVTPNEMPATAPLNSAHAGV